MSGCCVISAAFSLTLGTAWASCRAMPYVKFWASYTSLYLHA
jgi:hypothetical protein